LDLKAGLDFYPALLLFVENFQSDPRIAEDRHVVWQYGFS
jgi:hypothetical protein